MKIIIDNREHDLISKLRQCDNFEFTIEALDIGDIEVRNDDNVPIFSIERKTFADWESSIVDGRYKEQKFRLLHAGHRVAYVLEGSESNHKKRKRIHENALRGSLLNTSIRDGLSIIRTTGIDDTAKLVTELEKRLSKTKIKTGLQPPSIQRASKRVRMSDPNVILIRMLLCIPGISENIATKIVDKYKTKRAIIDNANNDEIGFSEIVINEKGRKLGLKVVKKIQKFM